ncbi:MAG: SDR family oxidoreductase [Rhodospirillaceae bacterium]|jgi:citronellol/citronellal dehydrogenase|nr:SDR family oxidoreductase [Rhodospirillaceae bacterium]MBT7836689.1 SDR family oxidoreductase [Rhodospirillaceae bacterium]
MPYGTVFRPGLFAGETIIVTGGGSGIGRCTAHELAALGAKVVLVGRRRENLLQVQAEIIEDGGHADIQVLDIRVEEDVIAAVDMIINRDGPINGLVNNAGGQYTSPLEEISQKGWETVVRTNLTGGFLMSREVFRQSMKKAGGGAIVNITADHWMSMPSMGHSGAARGGMENFTMTAAVEWGRFGVRVNSVAPGWVITSGFDTYPESFAKENRALTKVVPLARLGREAEVAGAIVFLLSPSAAYISGSCIRVDGAAPNAPHNYPLPEGPGNQHFDGFHREVRPKSLGDPDDT